LFLTNAANSGTSLCLLRNTWSGKASKRIEAHYGKWISPKLLEAWLSDPSKAPGRWVSGPWPDRIEIGEITFVSEHVYEVTGNIIEVTGVEHEIAARMPVVLRAGKRDTIRGTALLITRCSKKSTNSPPKRLIPGELLENFD